MERILFFFFFFLHRHSRSLTKSAVAKPSRNQCKSPAMPFVTAIIMVQASEACIDSAHRNACPSFYVTGWHRLRSLVSIGTHSYISIRQNRTSDVPRKMRCFRKQGGDDEIADRRCVRGFRYLAMTIRRRGSTLRNIDRLISRHSEARNPVSYFFLSFFPFFSSFEASSFRFRSDLVRACLAFHSYRTVMQLTRAISKFEWNSIDLSI